MTRDYHSPARDQAKAETRERIVQAVIRVVLDDGIHAFTVQNVAKKAGVSHRTVYRHFATREDLLDGLNDSIEAYTRAAGVPSAPETLDDLGEVVDRAYQAFGGITDVMKAYVITTIALGHLGSWTERTRAFHRALARQFPHLGDDAITEASAMIRTIASSRTWHTLGVEIGLDPERAGHAARWAIETLLEDLRARNERAKPRS